MDAYEYTAFTVSVLLDIPITCLSVNIQRYIERVIVNDYHTSSSSSWEADVSSASCFSPAAVSHDPRSWSHDSSLAMLSL